MVIDETRRSFRLNLEGVSVSKTNLLPKADFKALEAAALLILCAEISGGLMGLLPVIVEYLNTRKAFDRLIGSYQALKHPTVDILMSLEAARSHLYHASTLFAQEMDDFESAIRMAKAHSSEALLLPVIELFNFTVGLALPMNAMHSYFLDAHFGVSTNLVMRNIIDNYWRKRYLIN